MKTPRTFKPASGEFFGGYIAFADDRAVGFVRRSRYPNVGKWSAYKWDDGEVCGERYASRAEAADALQQ